MACMERKCGVYWECCLFCEQLFKFYSFKTYISAFKSADTGYIHIFVKAVPTQVKTSEQGLKSAGTYPGIFEKHWYRSRVPIQTLTAWGLKRWDMNFDLILAVLKTLGQPLFLVAETLCVGSKLFGMSAIAKKDEKVVLSVL